MSAWKEDVFDNLVRLNRGFDLPNNDIVEGEYPVVASTSIKAYHNEYKVNPPGVITGRSGSLGAVQYVAEKYWPLNTTLYAKNYKGNYPKYVYYFLKTMNLENYNSGAGVPTLNQNHLHKLTIKIPPVPIQKKIAAILTAYDDLIENNNKRIALLEKAAEEMYREWFVRMRFPGWEQIKRFKGVPEGWDKEKIGNLCKIKGGKRLPKGENLTNEKTAHPYIKARDIRNGKINTSNLQYVDERVFDKIRNYTVKTNDVCITIVANIGDVGIVPARLNGASLTENAVKLINLDHRLHHFYLVYALATPFYKGHMEILSAGAAQSKLGIYKIASIELFLPPIELQKKFIEIILPIRSEIELLESSINFLKTARDQLLSHLISGKHQVDDLDIHFPSSMLAE